MTDDRKDVLDFARSEVKYPRSNVVSQLCKLVLSQEEELQRLRKPPAFNSNSAVIPMPFDAHATVETVVRRHIKSVLDALGGNKTRAARILDIDRRSLYRWIQRMAEPPSEKPSNPDPIGLHSMVKGNRE